MNYIILNGVNSNTITGLIIQELPPISKPLMRTQIDQIDGRDGDIVTKLGYSTVDKELSIGLHGNFDIDSVIEYFASEGTVIFSNEPDKYYRYQVLDQIDFERLVRFRTATVTMHCQPFKYEVNEDPIEEAGSTDTTGDIVSFETQSTDAVGVKVNLSPYQNLNGYDSPWVGGAEKNKLPTPIKGTYSSNGLTLTVDDKGVITVSGTTTSSGTVLVPLSQSYVIPSSVMQGGTGCMYLFNSFTTGQNNAFVMYYDDTRVETWQFTVANRKSDNWVGQAGKTINKIGIQFTSGQTYNGNFAPMFSEDGTTDATSFIPYSNICPIYPSNGKNLLPYPYSSGSSLTSNGITFTANADGSLSVSGTATANADFYFVGAYGQYVDAHIPSGSYILSMSRKGGTLSNNVRIYFVENGGSTVYASEASPLSCSVDSTKTYRIFMRIMSGTSVNEIYYPMIRPVEITDSTYVPYKAVGITRTGKNLFDKNAVEVGVYLDTVTGLPISASAYSVTDFIPVEEGVSVFIPASQSTRRWFYTKDRTPKTFLNNSNNQVYTPTEDGYIRVSISHNAIPLDTYQIEYGTSATQYEPYQGERYYPISDNPVYGGTLEVETGVLTVTRVGVTLNGTEAMRIANSGTSNWYYLWDSIFTGREAKNSLSDISSAYIHAGIANGNTAQGFTASGAYLRVRQGQEDTIANYKAWLSANPLTIVYELATPVQYQLTPTQVKTLLGYNNIWTDSGTVTVSVPNMISVVNEGNTTAKPTMTIYGSGNVGVWLNGMQVFQIALGDTGNITIDAEQMEAYQGGILRNRLVTGDYSNFVLQKGENTISVTGNVTNVEITNYSRWL